MDKGFFSYVFRPSHIVIIVLAVRGMLSGDNPGGFIALLVGEVIHFIARGVWYFVEQRAMLSHWKQKEQEKKQSGTDYESQK